MGFDAELSCYAALVLFLVVLSIQDLRCRSVNAMMMVIFLLLGLLLSLLVLKIPLFDMCLALIPGIILIMVSQVFGGSVGLGDACALLLVGSMNGIRETFTVLCTALALSIVPAMILFIKGKDGKKSMPFLPFICIGTIIVLAQKVR